MVDFGVLTLRPNVLDAQYFPGGTSRSGGMGIPCLPPSHPAVVEWRAMTVIELYVPPLPLLVFLWR